MSDDAVGRVINVADLVADQHDVEAEGVLKEALSKTRQRGGGE
jgi:hypothetical protein